MVLLKILHIVLLASVKYIVTLPYALIIGVEYKYAIVAVLVGGIGGFLLFYYLSKPLVRVFNLTWPCFCRLVPAVIKKRYSSYCEKRESRNPKRIFNWKSRFWVRLKSTYGLWGIIIATPVILTIPIGAFLVNRYYSHKKNIVWYMILSIIGWAGVLSGLIFLFPGIFF